MRQILLSAIVAVCGPVTLLAQHVPAGPEFAVNTFTTNTQGDSSVLMDPAGNFVVVWPSFGQDGSGFGIFGRRYDNAGTPQGTEFQINTFTTGNQLFPSIAGDSTGNFVVVWASFGQDGSDYGVFGQRFDSAGTPQGAEFQINTFTTDAQGGSTAIAMDPPGNFVVVWNSFGQDGYGYGVFGQRFDSTGTARGTEFQINNFTAFDQFATSAGVASDPTGDFVVTWESFTQDGDGFGVFARRFDAAGSPLGPEFQVNTTTLSTQKRPDVAVDQWGNFVVLWNSFSQDGSSWGVFGQRFDDTGAPLGSEFQVNTETNSGQVVWDVATNRAGNFMVVWYSAIQDGSLLGIFGQGFDHTGARQGLEFQINTFTTSDQSSPSVATDAEGNFVVTWWSYGQDGSDLGIFGQRFSCALPVPGRATSLEVLPANGGADLLFTWTDAPDADDYLVLEDALPNGGFDTVIGEGASGAMGVSVPVPPGVINYFLVAGRNSCSLGPKR